MERELEGELRGELEEELERELEGELKGEQKEERSWELRGELNRAVVTVSEALVQNLPEPFFSYLALYNSYIVHTLIILIFILIFKRMYISKDIS